MTARLGQDDRGKAVVYDDTRIGVVTDVRSGTAYVDPEWDHAPDRLRETLDWDDDESTLDEDAVTNVDNGEVRLRTDLTA